MAKRNSMRDGPLAQLFKATEAGQSADKTDEEEPARGRAKPKSSPGTSRPQLIDLPDPDDSSTRNFPRPEGQPYLAVIRVVGVGGGGCNAVNRMIEAGVKGVEFIAVNTDAQALEMSRCADVKHPHRRRASPRASAPAATPRSGEQAGREQPRADRACCAAPTWCSSPRAMGGGTGTGARAGGRRDRPRAGRADGRRGHPAVRLRGQRAARAQADEGSSAARARRHADRHPQRPPDEVLEQRHARWSRRSGWPTTCCARACRASAT